MPGTGLFSRDEAGYGRKMAMAQKTAMNMQYFFRMGTFFTEILTQPACF
jgi:hypothetical protein